MDVNTCVSVSITVNLSVSVMKLIWGWFPGNLILWSFACSSYGSFSRMLSKEPLLGVGMSVTVRITVSVNKCANKS